MKDGTLQRERNFEQSSNNCAHYFLVSIESSMLLVNNDNGGRGACTHTFIIITFLLVDGR